MLACESAHRTFPMCTRTSHTHYLSDAVEILSIISALRALWHIHRSFLSVFNSIEKKNKIIIMHWWRWWFSCICFFMLHISVCLCVCTEAIENVYILYTADHGTLWKVIIIIIVIINEWTADHFPTRPSCYAMPCICYSCSYFYFNLFFLHIPQNQIQKWTVDAF